MNILTETPQVLAEQKELEIRILKIELQEMTHRRLRRKFDEAVFMSTKVACLELAKELSLDDLAEDMESDLKEV